MTDPREPFETDSPVEGTTATDLDDARVDERGSADVETGAGETGAAEGSSDTADLTADNPVVEASVSGGGNARGAVDDALVGDPLAEPAPDHDPLTVETLEAAAEAEALGPRIREAMIEPDPDDDRDTLVEIRAAAGGEEAALFARDLVDVVPAQQVDVELRADALDRGGQPGPVLLRPAGVGVEARLGRQ